MKIRGSTLWWYVIVIAVLVFGLTQLSALQTLSGQVVAGLVAAAITAAGMLSYGVMMLNSRSQGRARVLQSSYPSDVQDVPPG
jgi:hypothetical protein